MPYSYVINNPLKYTDPTGNEIDGGASWYAQQAAWDAAYQNHMYEYTSWTTFLNSEKRDFFHDVMGPSGGGQTIGEVNMGEGDGDKVYLASLKEVVVTIKRTTGAQGNGGCPNCLNPATTGNNLLGLTYPGGNNPKSYNGQYNYSYVPTNLSEYPAIGHDRRYDNLKITGASGLFTDTRAIGADWRFVGEELSIAGNPYLNPIDRMSAGILGLGLGLSALPKTLFQLSTPFGYMQTMMWYNFSNQGVNNAPTIHKD